MPVMKGLKWSTQTNYFSGWTFFVYDLLHNQNQSSEYLIPDTDPALPPLKINEPTLQFYFFNKNEKQQRLDSDMFKRQVAFCILQGCTFRSFPQLKYLNSNYSSFQVVGLQVLILLYILQYLFFLIKLNVNKIMVNRYFVWLASLFLLTIIFCKSQRFFAYSYVYAFMPK